RVAVHTCGARGADALAPLQRLGASCGVLHPFQTIPSAEQGVGSLHGITFGVVGDLDAVQWSRVIATLLGGQGVSVDPTVMSVYQASAVFAANGITALMDAAVLLLERSGFGRESALQTIGPLARATIDNVLRSGPETALTGPVLRGDSETVRA